MGWKFHTTKLTYKHTAAWKKKKVHLVKLGQVKNSKVVYFSKWRVFSWDALSRCTLSLFFAQNSGCLTAAAAFLLGNKTARVSVHARRHYEWNKVREETVNKNALSLSLSLSLSASFSPLLSRKYNSYYSSGDKKFRSPALLDAL